MRSIQPSIDNAFLFWAGDPTDKLGQINIALRSLSFHNPDKRIYLFTNELSADNLDKEVVRNCPLSIVNWCIDELVQETPFSDRGQEFYPSFLKKRGAKCNQWMVFSDFFRYIALWRWGGTYLDLDDISVRPMTQQTNVVCCSIAQSDRHEAGWGQLARDRNSAGERYFRLFNDPMIRFEPGNNFIRKCLEVALTWPPDLAGSRVMTEVYGRGDEPPPVTVRLALDVWLHPQHTLLEYVARHCGWDEKWWWFHFSAKEYHARWSRLLRLGQFSLFKNHGWASVSEENFDVSEARRLIEWIHHAVLRTMDHDTAMENDTKVSVVIPTHQQQFLSDTLDSLAEQSDGNFEVIVVENGLKQAGTEELVLAREGAISVQYVFEENLGLNVARNVGCGRAKGSILALLDDDCIPSPNWIKTIRKHFARNPGANIIAGRVSLRFRAQKPEWVTGEFRSLLSEIDVTPNDSVNNTNAWIVGANFSFRKEVFTITGGFDEEIGMVGKTGPQLCHDETEFCRRAEDLMNTEVTYSKEISVEHQVPAERLQVDFFERRRYGQGISDIGLIFDRERRSISEALEKLERQLYDTGWLRKLSSSGNSVKGRSRELVVINSIRTRIEYIGGLAAACLEIIPDREEIRKAIVKYENRARVAAVARYKDKARTEEGLTDLAQLMVDSAVKKPANHHRCIKPSVMLGRAAFFRAIKRELVSQMA